MNHKRGGGKSVDEESIRPAGKEKRDKTTGRTEKLMTEK
jgi:hypothetical protein